MNMTRQQWEDSADEPMTAPHELQHARRAKGLAYAIAAFCAPAAWCTLTGEEWTLWVAGCLCVAVCGAAALAGSYLMRGA